MQRNRWHILPAAADDVRERFPEWSSLVIQLLVNRGLTTQTAIDAFLSPDYATGSHNPFILQDMERACQRIEQAITNHEKIMVWGDYDADGVSSAAIMVTTLEKLMGKRPMVFIPNRDAGYGLNLATITDAVAQKVTLLITTDCGISNDTEIAAAAEAGIDVIVTDHHQEPLVLPKRAYAIINPQLARETYPFRELSGSGVAFKLAQALIRRNRIGEAFEKWLLDLVALGTIADCMPLVGENRVLVKYGLVVLRKTSRIGVRRLVAKMGKELSELDEQSIAWQLGPRLNASGRIERANTSFDLLTTTDPDEAEAYAAKIESLNQERQRLTEQMTKEIKVRLDADDATTRDRVLFAYDPAWQIGLVGLVAGKLKEQYSRPFFVMTEEKGMIKGSGRSIGNLDITHVLTQVDDLLDRYGGHHAACGFTLKSPDILPLFQKRVAEIVSRDLTDAEIEPTITIDARVDLEEVTWELFELLEKFSPYGEGNWHPRYLAEGLEVVSVRGVGKDANHLQLMVKHNSQLIKKTIGFGFGNVKEKLVPGKKIDLVFEVGVNEWNGNRELELKIIDLRHHDKKD